MLNNERSKCLEPDNSDTLCCDVLYCEGIMQSNNCVACIVYTEYMKVNHGYWYCECYVVEICGAI